MRKGCGEGVEAVSRLIFDRKAAVKAVVYDVQSGERELRADLVRDAGKDRHLEKRTLLVFNRRVSNRLELRHRV